MDSSKFIWPSKECVRARVRVCVQAFWKQNYFKCLLVQYLLSMMIPWEISFFSAVCVRKYFFGNFERFSRRFLKNVWPKKMFGVEGIHLGVCIIMHTHTHTQPLTCCHCDLSTAQPYIERIHLFKYRSNGRKYTLVQTTIGLTNHIHCFRSFLKYSPSWV